jgi:hypothetical protein
MFDNGAMRKLLAVFLLIAFVGCGPANRVPIGKTVENDWERDEMMCRQQSGKVTGVLAPSVVGFWENKVNGADDRYMKCMRDLGWYE